MEGGTDFDLQVLEVPTAPTASAGDVNRAGAGEKSQEDRLGGSRSAPTSSEARGSQVEEVSCPGGRDRKDSQRVRVHGPAPDWTTAGHMLFLSQDSSRQNGEDREEEEDEEEVKQTKKVGVSSALV